MEKQVYFSIILPTFNRAHLISKAVDSVIYQTFEDWELIIVDDGSTDNTKELINSYQENDSRIRYIYQENAERSAARNKGIDYAKGVFVCFLDSDDYFLPNHLFLLYEYISDEETIYYVGLVLNKDGNLSNRAEAPVTGLKQFDQLCLATIHSQQVCIPSKIAKIFKFDKTIRIAEDLELWIRINDHYVFHYIENSFSVVVVNHSERTVDLRNNVGLEQLATYSYIFSDLHSGKLISSNIKKTLLSATYFTIFKYWLYKKKRLKAIFNLSKSIWAMPFHEQTKYRINLLIKLMSGSNFSKMGSIL